MPDEKPYENFIDPQGLERENENAFNKIREMTSDLRAVQEREREILSGNNDSTEDAKPADPCKF